MQIGSSFFCWQKIGSIENYINILVKQNQRHDNKREGPHIEDYRRNGENIPGQ